MPQVSVIIPTYNRRLFLQEAIESILAQTYTDYEIIVIDDGSTDGTSEALRDRYGDKIRCVRQSNQGESAARNHGIKISHGKFIALLDSDDMWVPEKLATQVPILNKYPNIVMVLSSAFTISRDGSFVGSPNMKNNINNRHLTLESLCLKNPLGDSVSTALIRHHTLTKVGGFDPDLHYGEDWDLWLRLRHEGPFKFIKKPLAYKRQHSGSQWHSPQPKTVDKRLADHLRMLEKVFSTWNGELPDCLPERSVARAYGLAAFLDYLIGRPELGKQRIIEALKLDPGYLLELKRMPGRLMQEFLNPNSALTSSKPPRVNIQNAVKSINNLPSELQLTESRKSKLLSDLYIHYLFYSFKVRDFDSVRYCLPKAIMIKPSLLRKSRCMVHWSRNLLRD